MKASHNIAVCAALLSFVLPQAFALDGLFPDFPDSAEVRAGIFDTWLGRETNGLLFQKPETVTDSLENAFAVSQQKQPSQNQILISVTPIAAQSVAGTWTLARRLSDGVPLSIRVHPVNDPDIWITLRPDGGDPEKGRSRLSLTVCGIDACRDITVGIPFIRLYTAPLSTIVSLTRNTVPWDLLTHDPDAYADVIAAVPVIREGLKSLVYLDDGCFDENGIPVRIESGAPQEALAVYDAAIPGQDRSAIIGGVNCSGFAKWLIDGIVRPVAGNGLKIGPLKGQTASPETHFTEGYRESKDLFFALDWTRNLASAAVSLNAGRTVRPDSSGVDVTIEPFAGMTGYAPNIGYRARDVLPLLYYLATKEPGHMYLGAISRENADSGLRTYHHVAAFLPYFDGDGRFTVSVFESARETNVTAFARENADAWVNLVRVRVPEKGHFLP